MKKVIMTVAVALLANATFAQSLKSNNDIRLQKYLSRKVNSATSYASQGVQGTVRLKVSIDQHGIQAVDILNGVDPIVDAQILAVVKNTPGRIISKMDVQSPQTIVIPVKLVLASNE